MDTMLFEAAEALFADVCTPKAVHAIEAGGNPLPMWEALDEAGFANALVRESHGGAGLGLTDVFGVLFAAGRHAVPVPLAATLLARGWLDANGHACPAGLMALAPLGVRRHAQGCQAARVALGAQADQVLGVCDGQACLLPVAEASAEPDGVQRSLVVSLTWPSQSHVAPLGPAAGLLDHAAAGQTALLAGAADRVLQLSLQYVQERCQFGRSIGKFQAIQHQLAVMAEHAAMMRMAAQIACTAGPGKAPVAAAVEAGMAVCAERAGQVAAIGHAVHGAIGVTVEHVLQVYTRRLQQWSTDLGSAAYWARRLGERALTSTHTALDVIRCEVQQDAAVAG
ncbi:acyl-CoA dehydrogenase family protein [Achromobacter sp. GG226]|uniref:acyl-CoA dehydrogenase family protein n=1 Tax=Verticiella alkaliphila TaxID=2779529 RepID=UPI001C0E3EDB|nr:acyl-CoA dehydrogenase family protein [Verticiella sp. GG226]MBU4610158.1 acyl-CoA dehydrogenase family protein [Verticiella sp. GG226]